MKSLHFGDFIFCSFIGAYSVCHARTLSFNISIIQKEVYVQTECFLLKCSRPEEEWNIPWVNTSTKYHRKRKNKGKIESSVLNFQFYISSLGVNYVWVYLFAVVAFLFLFFPGLFACFYFQVIYKEMPLFSINFNNPQYLDKKEA